MKYYSAFFIIMLINIKKKTKLSYNSNININY